MPSDPRAVDLIELPARAIDALAAGDLGAANAAAPVLLTTFLIEPAPRRTWQMRSEQIAAHPADAAWITRVILDPSRNVVVGQAGFHGPPDEAGMVEVGYSVDPAHRRQGYARAALEALLARAKHEPEVSTVRATISPDNVISRDLVLQHGFVEVGEQWDDEDGLEIIYEIAAG
ncbi:MAG: GNAT family N-acetyltransferase [Mycobacteriales bacterium]